MKLYTNIPASLLPFFKRELILAENNLRDGNLSEAWNHYERAHILGQKYPYEHTLVHWRMLLFGIRIKSRKEILGQVPRLLFGGVKSFVGHIPEGNTGGANVPPLKPMEIPESLKIIMEQNS